MEKEETNSASFATNADVSVKYQKLATEYAKIRSQLNVLKKGILDEQNKTAILKDELNERDKTIRKYEQEIDSYSFRNQQLEKRVGILQGDLTEKTKKGNKKSDSKKNETATGAHASASNSVPLNELLTKIDENVQLTRQIAQQEETFKRQLLDLTNTGDEKLTTATNHFRGVIQELEKQNGYLRRSLESSNAEINALRSQISEFEARTKSLIGGVTTLKSPETPETDDFPRDLSNAVPCDLISKLVKSQQQTEHWKLEYELSKIKNNKTLSKYEECKKHLKNLGREDLIVTNNELTSPDATIHTLFGKMAITSSGKNYSEWSENQEKELISYFSGRINDLIHLLQLCDSKALTFHDECKALQAHLMLAVEEKSRIQKTFDDLQTKHLALSEELLLITSTYEDQLQTLTEHIANMNDKLASQTDTIDHLESQLKQGAKKK